MLALSLRPGRGRPWKPRWVLSRTPPGAPYRLWRIGRDWHYAARAASYLLARRPAQVAPARLANTAAALAVALAAGASQEGCRQAARKTLVPPHRVQLVERKTAFRGTTTQKRLRPPLCERESVGSPR